MKNNAADGNRQRAGRTPTRTRRADEQREKGRRVGSKDVSESTTSVCNRGREKQWAMERVKI
jgi:hypothetical protein